MNWPRPAFGPPGVLRRSDYHRLTPSAWFLPDPVCMRGGAAQQFASDRRFHRGSHPEATFDAVLKIVILNQSFN